MPRRWLYTASLILSGCSLWPTADIECLMSGRCSSNEQTPFPDGPGPVIFGQPDDKTNLQMELGLNYPTGALHVSGRLFIVDQANHRVLIWNSLPSGQSRPDVVLGQPDLTTDGPNNPVLGPSSLYQPRSIATDGTRLFVADSGNRRVLIWNTLPTSNAQPADMVLGQPDFTSSAAGLSAAAFGDQPDVAYAGKLMVTDHGNNRLLIWNTLPARNYTNASVVVGQLDMTSGAPNRGLATASASGLSSPTGQAALAGSSVCLADTGNHRTLCWNTTPTVNGTDASVVFGQTTMNANQVNAGSAMVGAVGMSAPISVAGLSGGRFLVADRSFHRVLEWPGGLTTNGSPAEVVIGQPTLTTGSANYPTISASSLNTPEGVTVYSGTQDGYVADSQNHRVLYYDDVHLPTNAPPVATKVFGQPNFGENEAHNPGVRAGNAYGLPIAVSGGGGRLALCDRDRHRVLLWNSIPESAGELPSLALGQPDLISTDPYHGGAIAGDGFELPSAVWTDGTRLFVADAHRVLMWSQWPTAGLQRADVVLGQNSFSTNKANQTGVGADSLWQAGGVASDGTRLFVADTYNHRVLVWNSLPTNKGQKADFVLGQSDFASNGGNAGGAWCLSKTGPSSAQSVICPQDVATDGTRLVVGAAGEHRVMIWNSLPTTTNAPADVVLGQPSFLGISPPGTATASAISLPFGVSFVGTRLYVTDYLFNRVLYWNTPPTSNNQPASGVIGQSDFSGTLPNNGGLTSQRLSHPTRTWGSGERLFIADAVNYRMISMAHP